MSSTVTMEHIHPLRIASSRRYVEMILCIPLAEGFSAIELRFSDQSSTGSPLLSKQQLHQSLQQSQQSHYTKSGLSSSYHGSSNKLWTLGTSALQGNSSANATAHTSVASASTAMPAGTGATMSPAATATATATAAAAQRARESCGQVHIRFTLLWQFDVRLDYVLDFVPSSSGASSLHANRYYATRE